MRLRQYGFPRSLLLRETANYTIEISNDGNGPALDLRLIDTIPECLDFVSATPRGNSIPPLHDRPGKLIWNFDEIPANSSVEIHVEMRAKKRGVCVNSVRLIGLSSRPPRIEPMIAEASTRIRGMANPHIFSTDDNDPCEISKQVVYVIKVKNEGTSAASHGKLCDRIPQEMEFIDAEGPTEYKYDKESRRLAFGAYPLLQPDESLFYKIRCIAVKAGSARNTAHFFWDEFEDGVIDEEGTSVYQ